MGGGSTGGGVIRLARDQRAHAAVRRHFAAAEERRLQLKGYPDAVRARIVSGHATPADAHTDALAVS